MQMFRSFGGAAAILAVSAMALPAQAQSRRYGGGPRHHHHHREDKVDAGGLILGALLVGGLFAMSSAEKKKREREAAYFDDYERKRDRDAVYRDDFQAPAADAGALPDGVPVSEPQGSPVPEIPAPDAAAHDGLYDPDAAADRCAVAAETQAQQFARLAHVSAITDNVWNGKSWVIKGWVEVAESYNQSAKPRHKFRCALRAGSEPVVSIEGLAAI